MASCFGDATASLDAAIQFLRNKKCLQRTAPLCDVCGGSMTQVKHSGFAEGLCWRCPRHKSCRKSLRIGSFWSKGKLSLLVFLEVAFEWVTETPVTWVPELVNISQKTAIDYYQWLRDVCTYWFHTHPIRIGGVGQVVEIKHHRCRLNRSAKWIFAGYSPVLKVGFLELVPDESAATLMPLVQKYILPGTHICSDPWPAYDAIQQIPVNPAYTHSTVSQTQHFLDPVSSSSTKHVDGFWRHLKRKLNAMSGVPDSTLPSHLDEFLWRQRYGKTLIQCADNLFAHISQLFPTKGMESAVGPELIPVIKIEVE